MSLEPDEERDLRSVTLENARSIFRARQRAEEELFRAKEALQKQSEWLRVTLDSIGDGVMTTDTECRVLSLNWVAEELTGWTRSAALGRPLAEVLCVVDEQSREPGDDIARRALDEVRIVGPGNPTILVARDGRETPIEDSAAPMRDERGQVHGVVLTFRSIAERREAEESLRRSERELADFFENASVGLHWVGPDGTVLRVNQAELAMLGYSREEYVGRSIADFHVDPAVSADILQRLAAGETLHDREARMRCKDGSVKDVLIDSSVLWEDGRFVHTRSFTRDITERKRAEQRLRTQDRVTRALAESATLEEAASKILRAICEHLGWQVGALWYVDQHARVLRCADMYHLPSVHVPRFESDSRQRTFERGRGLPGRVWETGQAAWIRDVVQDGNFARASIAEAEGLHSAFGFPITHDGDMVGLMEFLGHEIRPPDADLLQMMTAVGSQIGQFIERKRAEEALRRWEHIFRQAGWSVAVVHSSDDSLETVNPAFAAMHGYTVEELVGRPLAETIAPECREELLLHVRAAEEKGDHVYESAHIRKDGTRFPCLTHVTAFRDAGGKVLFRAATFQDLTEIRAAAQAVRESEARFRQLADAMPQIVWTARPDGSIDYYNERWYDFTGFDREEQAQAGRESILHPDDVQRTLDTYRGCIEGGRPYEIEYRFMDRRTGGFRWFLARAVPVRDEQGRIVRWFGTCTDVHDTKQAEQTTRFLADAGAALAELTDPRSTLERVADLAVPFFADLCVVDLAEPDGSLRPVTVTHNDSAKVQLVHDLLRRYPPGPSASSGSSFLVSSPQDEEHLRLLRALGLKSHICTPLRSRSRTLGALTFATTESGRIFDALDLAAAEDLAHRAVIAIENAQLLATLQEADRRKDEFLAMLAHELRNPLAPIRNAVQIFRTKGLPAPELQWGIEAIDRQVHQMTRLVDDLLDVSRITRGRIELRKELVDLSVVVSGAVEASRPLIEKWDHELTVTLPEQPIRLEADPTRLAQVLSNLLNNAAKYTDQGGRIRLTVDAQEDQARIRVEDNGIGIPAEMQQRIFDLFTQVDRSMERSEGGLGIGLTLVRRLVDMHGGTVEARSDGPGKGSQFVVLLPLVVEGEGKRRSGAAGGDPVVAAAARRILVVDDNRDAAISLGLLLRMTGNVVHVAHDGLEAVGAAAAFRPDVVLLDIGLPKLNGYEAARQIREQHGGKAILLVALTGWGQEEDRRRSAAAGFDHHLIKPVEFQALQKLLATFAARSESKG